MHRVKKVGTGLVPKAIEVYVKIVIFFNLNQILPSASFILVWYRNQLVGS